MSLTSKGEDLMLELFKDSGTYYLALYTTTVSEAGGGTEISGGGYARQKVVFTEPSNGQLNNSAQIEFPVATSDWGTANGWALCNAATGGDVIWYGTISSPKELLTGDIYRVPVSYLVLRID